MALFTPPPSTDLLRVLWAVNDYWQKSNQPPAERVVCYSWVVQAHEEKFGGSFHQSKLHNLAKLGFLKPEWSSNDRRYYSVPNPGQVRSLSKNSVVLQGLHSAQRKILGHYRILHPSVPAREPAFGGFSATHPWAMDLRQRSQPTPNRAISKCVYRYHFRRKRIHLCRQIFCHPIISPKTLHFLCIVAKGPANGFRAAMSILQTACTSSRPGQRRDRPLPQCANSFTAAADDQHLPVVISPVFRDGNVVTPHHAEIANVQLAVCDHRIGPCLRFASLGLARWRESAVLAVGFGGRFDQGKVAVFAVEVERPSA